MRKSTLMAALLLAMALVAAVPALAQEEEPERGLDDGPPDLGIITSISGDRILVEEDPSVGSPLLPGGDKGYFTVTGETEISSLLGGDAVVPASFEDLETGQSVAATYEGGVAAASYPSQGIAGSIVILDGFPGNVNENPGAGFVQYDNAA